MPLASLISPVFVGDVKTSAQIRSMRAAQVADLVEISLFDKAHAPIHAGK